MLPHYTILAGGGRRRAILIHDEDDERASKRACKQAPHDDDGAVVACFWLNYLFDDGQELTPSLVMDNFSLHVYTGVKSVEGMLADVDSSSQRHATKGYN